MRRGRATFLYLTGGEICIDGIVSSTVSVSFPPCCVAEALIFILLVVLTAIFHTCCEMLSAGMSISANGFIGDGRHLLSKVLWFLSRSWLCCEPSRNFHDVAGACEEWQEWTNDERFTHKKFADAFSDFCVLGDAG